MTRQEREWQRLREAAEKAPRGYRRAAKGRLAAYAHSLLASDVGVQQPVMYVPIGFATPPGWRLVEGQDMRHHHAYSQMVQRG